MKPTKTSPAFEKFVQETIDEGIAYLSQHGWLDLKTGGPDVTKISELLELQETRLPVEVEVAVTRSKWNGPAQEIGRGLRVGNARQGLLNRPPVRIELEERSGRWAYLNERV